MSIFSSSTKNDVSTTKEKLHDASAEISTEFKSFVNDIESLIKETASLTGDDLARAKIKLNQRIIAAKQNVNGASNVIMEQARRTAARTNEMVHDKPWAVIGTGALVSFVLGVLLTQSCKSERSAR